MPMVSYAYVSLYATSDNETHFRMFSSIWWKISRFQLSRFTLAVGFRVAEHFCSHFRLNGASQIFRGEFGTRRLPAKLPRSCGVASSSMPVTVPRMKWRRGT
jgi:hypothetical protein